MQCIGQQCLNNWEQRNPLVGKALPHNIDIKGFRKMDIKKILIANRGEISIRISRAAADMGIESVAVFSTDDSKSLHVRSADQAYPLEGRGAIAYLDIDQIIAAAKVTGCDAIHPGYGFLSENGDFARRCAKERLIFIGPRSDLLDLFGSKTKARELAQRCGVPLLPATSGACSLEEAKAFFASLGPDAAVMIKAIMGGGGRGMRPVYNPADLDDAYVRCQSEARATFGCGDVYVEKLMKRPRHIEVQIVGDGKEVIHLGERDCTMQRRNQKLIEIAPCPTLSTDMRDRITIAALCLARESNYLGLVTMEFLLEEDENVFAFMEANPRLQVEHTITEEVTGVDLVRTQIEIASGKSLADLGLSQNAPHPNYYAMQLRINMETIDSSGAANPAGGKLKLYEVPSGPGIRVDGYGYNGYTSNPAFDSLLAKLIVTSRSSLYEDLVRKAGRALSEFRIEGIDTNISFLRTLLSHPEFVQNHIYTRFVEEHAHELVPDPQANNSAFFEDASSNSLASEETVPIAPEGTVSVTTPILGRIVSIEVVAGDLVTSGQTVAVIEAMKMEYEIKTDHSGYVRSVWVAVDDVIAAGDSLLFLEEAELKTSSAKLTEEIDLDAIRPDLAEVIARHAFGLDEQRPNEAAQRHKKNQRTARENIQDLCDSGSFIEYGALALAAQRGRRAVDDLIRKTPADGLITGIASVNNELFGEEKARCMVMAYDYTVLAGTQGFFNHKKMDRMLKIAQEQCLPLVLLAEGGGGRPGDTDANAVAVAGLDLTTFGEFASLSGKAPLVGIASGACFAGNAALLGCCDVIIATQNSNIGMGGPVMIEGGGLGTFRPEEIGPIEVQTRNGVVDIAVADEAEAVAVAKKYLAYFQGAIPQWQAADQRLLRQAIPENRLRVYDIRSLINTLADKGSVLELRPEFGLGMITALIRIEGRPMGLIANNPQYISGAIEAEGADKAARLMQICNAFGLPVLSLCDTPGFMVGPEIENRAQVRHVCRMFVVGSHLRVPYFTVVLRKGYGLGAMAMARGGFHSSFFTTSWPSGEFGGMGLEGAVKAGFKKELEAIADLKERDKLYRKLVAQMYEMGKGINMASYLEIDSVIDPADTRRWILQGLKSIPGTLSNENGNIYIDTW